MKHSILGFQQTKLLENGLKMDDALILRVVKDMFSSISMEFKDFEGTRCMWVNYTYFLKQIPIIGSKSNLMSKIKSYEEKGLIVRKLENSKNGIKGTYAYISPTLELDRLQDYDPIQNLDTPLSKIKIPPIQNLDNKDSSSLDTTIKQKEEVKKVIKKLDVNKTINEYTTNPQLKTTLIEFLDMRRKQKDGITDTAITKMLTKLTKISKTDAEKIEILDNSIICSYKGIFPLKIGQQANVCTPKRNQDFGSAY